MKKIKVLLVYPNLMLVSTLPNNISILSACLKQEGHEVKLFDATLFKTTDKSNDEMRVERMQVRKFNIKDQGISLKEKNIYSEFKEAVDSYKPDLIGVTAVDDTVDMGLALVNASEAKKKNIPVIFGGVHAIFNSADLLKNDVVDMVCIGEGEETITKLAQAIAEGQPLSTVPNMWFKEEDGTINKECTLSKAVDLDALPFEDFSIFEEERLYRPMQGKMLRMLPINFDRGCPYRCTFCAAPSFNQLYKKEGDRYLRMKSNERIEAEIEFQLKHYNVQYLYFNSETFLSMPLAQFREFARYYKKHSLPFWCQTRIETVTDEKIKILKDMNCDRVSVGLETGSEIYRKTLLKKTFSNDQVKKSFEILNKYEMKISVNNVIGFPDETREMIFETINLNREIKADSINGFVFQPYTGTEMREMCIKKGYISRDHKNTESPIGDPVLDMPQISKDELKGLLRTFVLYVKMPESYFPRIRKAEELTEEGDKELSELRELLFEKYF